MPLVNFTNLDFDQIKVTLREYLRANSNFTDYDFDGSNLSAILEVLAYNTYINAYNANMISNEVFIDSATLRENIVALARNIGYIPRSRKSAKATVTFSVNTSNIGLTEDPVTLTLKKGIVFTSENVFGENYVFSIPHDITVPVVSNIANFDQIEIYEGTYINANFTYQSNNPNQRFILNNPNIDTSLINILVRDNEQSTVSRNYNIVDNLFGVTSTSRVCFIQEVEDQRYELIFGDGKFGAALENNNYINVSYVVTNGPSGNNISAFNYNGRILDNNDNIITSGISAIQTNTPAQGGAEIESVSSIRKYAPRIYSAQNRAVTAADYEAIIPRIYKDTESVSTFGGEELDPPQYGRVYLVIKPKSGSYLPNSIKENLKRDLKKYSVAGIIPEIIDLKYLYVEVNSTINYDSNSAPSANYVSSLVQKNVNSYAQSSELNKYGAKFKYSKFLKIIDESHESITSNITRVQMRRDLRPILNSFGEYEICYGNEFYVKDSCKGFNIKTSGFKVSGISGTVYMTDLPRAGGKTGTIFLFKKTSNNNYVVLRKSIGSVNYVKGEIKLKPINFISTSKFKGAPIIEISVSPKSNDIIGKQDLYLQLDINSSKFNLIPDDISSGSDPAGSNFYKKNSNLLSSYSTGELTR
jgi:hypothetical protein